MKKVLIIARAFPPAVGAGIRRVTAITKYLPLYGWEPIVLALKEQYYELIDRDSYSEIPNNIKVIRTNALMPIYNECDRKNLLKIGPSRILRGILNRTYIPDITLGWLPSAVKIGKKLIKKWNINIIFTSSPPFSEHFIGYFLKLATGKPWIADFRDPWVQGLSFPSKNALRKKLECVMEKRVVLNTDKITVVSHFMKENFLFNYPFLDSCKFEAITNGFDSQQFLIPNSKPKEKFIITYAGNFYPSRIPTLNKFLSALKMFIDENIEAEKTLEVRFIGSFPEENRALLRKLKLENVVKTIGVVSHNKSLEYQINSTILLLITGFTQDSKWDEGAKVFEYLRTGKPILALTHQGSHIEEIIKRTNTGKVILGDDVEGIKLALKDYYNQFKKNKKMKYLPKEEEINKFDWKELTKSFAILFDKTCNLR